MGPIKMGADVVRRSQTTDVGFLKFKDRRCCTDCMCVILFGLAMGGVFGILIAGINREPQLLEKLVRE